MSQAYAEKVKRIIYGERINGNMVGMKYYFPSILAVLFMHYSNTVHTFKNIKNGSYGNIHTFKNYFDIVFSIFNLSKNKMYPMDP